MPTAETLRALIALVEEAKAGSRELDIELWALHGDRRVRDVEGKLAYYETVKGGLWIRGIKPLRSLVPFYTTSIDAALALVAKVLPTWSLRLSTSEGYHHPNVGMGRSYPTNKSTSVDHHSSALAIILAMLKALLIEAEETVHVER